MAAGRVNSNVSPPWLWFWLATFLVVVLPFYTAVWTRNITDLLMAPSAGIGWVTGLSLRLLGLIGLLELIPSFALLGGLLLLLGPWIRTQYLEKKYALQPAKPSDLGMAEIFEFVQRHAPGIEVRTNRRLMAQTPFVYPLGFRRSAIALFGHFIRLWRANRPAAETILLHEIAHYQHGDTLVIGAGSPFRGVIEQWARLYLWLFWLPFGLSFAASTILFFWEISQLMRLGVGGGGLLIDAIGHRAIQTLVMMANALFLSAVLLIWTASIFVMPTIAVWCSELNADQAPVGHSQAHTLSTLKTLSEKARGREWLLCRLAHPPGKLRQWMVTHANTLVGKISLLLLFPLSFGLQVLLLRLLQSLAVAQGILTVPIDRVASAQSLSLVWISAAILLAVWPFTASIWQNLFCQHSRPARVNPFPYWVSAGVLTALAAITNTII